MSAIQRRKLRTNTQTKAKHSFLDLDSKSFDRIGSIEGASVQSIQQMKRAIQKLFHQQISKT